MKKILLFLIPSLIIIGVGIYFGAIEKEKPKNEYTVKIYDTYENYCDCIDVCGCPTGPKLLNTIKVKEGEKVTKPEDPKQEGRTFLGWALSHTSKDLYNFDTPVTKDIELYSVWDDNKHKVTFYQTYANYCNCVDCDCPSGPVVYMTREVRDGEKVPATDITQEGRTFVGWSLTVSGGELFDMETPITKDINLYAIYK